MKIVTLSNRFYYRELDELGMISYNNTVLSADRHRERFTSRRVRWLKDTSLTRYRLGYR